MILPIVTSKLEFISIGLASVKFFIRVSVLWTLESMKGWFPLWRKYNKQPADQTSHFKEYF